MASTTTAMLDLRPPPLVPNDEELETQIKNKLNKKKRSRVFSFLSRDSARNPPAEEEQEEDRDRLGDQHREFIPEDIIRHAVDDDENKPTTDVFQWVRLFENQRGMYFLGTARYSANVLFPAFDPCPYTVPTGETGRLGKEAMKTPYNLHDFQLPDKSWKWIGDWSVEMYGDGQVTYDGFVYNWIFRQKGWRPKAGFIRFVRRRSWVRLMMRPCPTPHLPTEVTHGPSVTAASEGDTIWRGDDGDWGRCHAAMKLAETDGKKLELWRNWVGDDSVPKRKRVQWTEDGELARESQQEELELTAEPSPIHSPKANPDYVVPVLTHHQLDICQSFKYPESRAKFLELVIGAGLHHQIPGGLRASGTGLDFWSRSSGLSLMSSPDQRATEVP